MTACRCIYRGEGEVVECESCILRRLAARRPAPAPALAGHEIAGALVVRVEGPPVGKGRPQFSTRGGSGARTPAKTREWEERARYAAARAATEPPKWSFGEADLFDVDVLACFPNNRRPDIDNVAKACLDALNGIAYRDDRGVVSLTVRSGGVVPEPYVLITVRRFVKGGGR